MYTLDYSESQFLRLLDRPEVGLPMRIYPVSWFGELHYVVLIDCDAHTYLLLLLL